MSMKQKAEKKKTIKENWKSPSSKGKKEDLHEEDVEASNTQEACISKT